MPSGILYNQFMSHDPEETRQPILIQEAIRRFSENDPLVSNLSCIPLGEPLRKLISNLGVFVSPRHGERYGPSVDEKEVVLPAFQTRQLFLKTFLSPPSSPAFKGEPIPLLAQPIENPKEGNGRCDT